MVWWGNQHKWLPFRDRLHNRLMPRSRDDHVCAFERLPVRLLGHPLVNHEIPNPLFTKRSIRVSATQNQFVVSRKILEDIYQLVHKILPVRRWPANARKDQRPNSTRMSDPIWNIETGGR